MPIQQSFMPSGRKICSRTYCENDWSLNRATISASTYQLV